METRPKIVSFKRKNDQGPYVSTMVSGTQVGGVGEQLLAPVWAFLKKT